MKTTIKESQLRNIVSESIKRILKETSDNDVLRYYNLLDEAIKPLYDVVCDCPKISQDLRNNILEAVNILKSCKSQFVKEGYVSSFYANLDGITKSNGIDDDEPVDDDGPIF